MYKFKTKDTLEKESLRGKLKSSSSAEVDFLDLCERNVRNIHFLLNGGNLLNQRQCQDLFSKISQTIQNIRELVVYCGASIDLFRPALENLYRYLGKAEVLVRNCAEKDWCAAAVFQCQNENAFRGFLLDVSLSYNAIYEQAKCTREDWNDPPQDLRLASVFLPATDSDVLGDQQDLQKRLDDLANGYTNFEWFDFLIPGRIARKRSLATYLLVKMCSNPLEPEASTLDTYSAVLWRKASEPSGTWGNSRFLGAGSGASGVCSTTWLGIPCAKKDFHGEEIEGFFLKEAGILAHLKHPCIVNFICCGNGFEIGDRFIAMELMEKSLFHLIEDQKGVPFSLPVAVDMMAQMARGVCYLHSRGVAHRDLKPQNVVVNRLTFLHLEDHYCVKLVDFGMSKIKVEVSKANTMTAKGIGTTMYRAPEAHPMANPDGGGKVNWLRADAFSFAMTCAHLLSLKIPFEGLKPSDLYKEVCKNARRPELPDMCPQDLVELLRDCWKSNPLSRPSFVEICTRLESFRYKDQGVDKDEIDSGTGLDFIKKKLEENSSSGSVLADEAEGKAFDLQVPILPCTCGCALDLLAQSQYVSASFSCNICCEYGYEEVYHCETCQFDAHPDCVTIKDKMEVFFHDHSLDLLVKYYYNDKLDALCYICKKSVQHSDWVYRCERCDLDVHAQCAKYPKERMSIHSHSLTLIQYLPQKSLSCNCCSGEVSTNTWRYTCIERWCAYDIHPYCTVQPDAPLCIFDGLHRLNLVTDQRGFHCSRCGALGFSSYYHCHHCNLDIHLDCLDETKEDEDKFWNEAYEKVMVEHGTKDNHTKMIMITQLLDNLLGSDALEANSSSTSSPPPVLERSTMKVQPTIRRLASSEIPGLDGIVDDVDLRRKIVAETAERKAKRMTAKAWRLKLKATFLGSLENLERIVVDLQSSESMLQGDAEVLASTFEKLKKRKYIVEEEMATQVQSRMRHGPRTCLFYLNKYEDRGVLELLSSLRADMEDVQVMFLCEEPGHQHFMLGSLCRVYYGALGEDRLQKLQPLLASGLEVVARAMSTLGGHLTQLDCVTLPNLGVNFRWDLRAIDLDSKHGKSSKGKGNAEELKRAEDTAADWLLSLRKVKRGVNYYEEYGLLRVRYKVTEEGKSPGYTRGSVAWLCSEHLHSGLEAGILESYPLMYYNPELN